MHIMQLSCNPNLLETNVYSYKPNEQKSIVLIVRRGQFFLYVLHTYFMDDLNWKILCIGRYEVLELKHILYLIYF